MNLIEGGNVFKDKMGLPLTQRIDQADIPGTVQWLETVTGLDLTGTEDPATGYPVKWLGSTGKKPSSGDLDLAVDTSEITKAELKVKLDQFAASQGQDPRDFVRMSGEAVHAKTPILGNADNGFVQTDFMFMPNVEWGSFFLSGGIDSEYKGLYRNILMSSIAKSLGLKASAKGVTSRATDQLIPGGLDPDYAAEVLLGKGRTQADLKNVEAIYAALARDPKKDAKLEDFRQYLARDNLKEPAASVAEDDVGFLGRLRDRIVNRGYVALVENNMIAEAAAPGVGGRAKGIEHLEDLVFRYGAAGIQQALDIVKHATESPATVTAKWDGKPAIVFGRNESGEFVLTDKSGFTAKGYQGRATSVAQLANIMNQRGSGRGELIAIYEKLFPLLRAATPENFKGYVQGDLLYTQAPQEISGNYEFKPNVVEYRIPVGSKLGQLITGTEVGVAIHTRYKTADANAEAIGSLKLNPVPGLLLIEPSVKDIQNVKPETQRVKQLKQLVRANGPAIDGLFNPAELRSAGITDLPQLCKRYINSRIDTNYENLLPAFGAWLQKNTTPRKFNNIVEYLQSPRSNMDGITAAFTAFLGLHELKMDMLQQLDLQQPGQEGWVLATPAGRAKLVNRFGFSAANRAQNNPKLATS